MVQNAIREEQVDEDKLCLLSLDEAREEYKEKRRDINDMLIFVVITIFILSFLFYLILPETRTAPLNPVYMEMAIFLFTVISGFTVSRQNNRYRQIMMEITEFDGSVSALYREFANFGGTYQDDFKAIALRHYEPIIGKHQWDYNITNKSSTLTDTYHLVKNLSQKGDISHVEHSSVSEIKKQLSDMQKNRKDMIALHAERIPQFQWFVIFFLAMMLIMTMSSVSSFGSVVESLLKASAATAIIAVIVMLRRLDTLDMFESFLGEHSAQDVINIFDGTK